MCNVMGIENVYDPDPTYELTADNVKKMLAIHMRFRFSLTSVLFSSQLFVCFLAGKDVVKMKLTLTNLSDLLRYMPPEIQRLST